MADATKIQWADATFNPWLGCTHASIGCANCYAEAMMDNRLGKAKWGPHGTRVLTSDANWRKPLKWNRNAVWRCGDCGFSGTVAPNADPEFICCGNCGCQVSIDRQRVFCASLADVFEDWDGPIVNHKSRELYRRECGELVAGCDACPRRGCDCEASQPATMDDVRHRLFGLIDDTPNLDWLLLTQRPERIGEYLQKYRRNVWLGTSVSDQETANAVVPELLTCGELAPVLFLSIEPLLSPVDLSDWLQAGRIDWVITGGESGPHARPCDLKWIRSIVVQCQEAGVACFVKQDYGLKSGEQGRLSDDIWNVKEFPCPTKTKS